MKRVLTALTMTLLAITATASIEDMWISDDVPEDVFNDPHFGGLPDTNPGLKIRVAQGFINMIHFHLLEYGFSWLNFEKKLKKKGHVGLNVWPFDMQIDYDNLYHDPFKFNLHHSHFDFVTADDGEPIVFVALPMIDYFSYLFDYNYKAMNGLIHGQGHAHFVENKTQAIVSFGLKATQEGHLYPHIHHLRLFTGDTFVNADNNTITSYFYGQVIKVVKHAFVNAINTFGRSVYNPMLPEYTRRLFSNQIHTFAYKMPQLSKHGQFNLNWAMTKNPHIKNGHVDFETLFDIGALNSPCPIKHDTKDYYFQSYDDQYMQFILSDRVVNCALHSMQVQHMLNYTFTSNRMLRDFGTKIKINAAMVSSAYPQIAQKYGNDQELAIHVGFEHPTVHFGANHGENIHAFTHVTVGIRLLNSMNYLVYDDLYLASYMNGGIKHEMIHANMTHLLLEPNSRKNGTEFKKMPDFNTLDLTEADYADFWEWANRWTDRWMAFFNDDVFGYGVPLPYQHLSFLSHIKFHNRAMLIAIGLFYSPNYGRAEHTDDKYDPGHANATHHL